MITPILKFIHSPDVLDLENHVIPDSEPFYILVQAIFGIKDGMGEESFDFMLCNLVWLAEETKHNLKSGRHLIIAQNFNFAELQRFFENLASASSAENWEEVGKKLGRFGQWEFEDDIEYVDPSRLNEKQVRKAVVTSELRTIDSLDVRDMKRSVIPDNEAFCISIQALFGRKGGSEEKAFSFVVCNPMWLAEATKSGPISKPHLLIAKEFSYVQLQRFLENIAKFSIGANWDDVCIKLGRYGESKSEDSGEFGEQVGNMSYQDGDWIARHLNPVWRDRANYVFHAYLDAEDGKNRWEQLWGKKIDSNRCIVCCIPFFFNGCALGDEIELYENSNFKRVLQKSNQATLRVWFGDQDDATIDMVYSELQTLKPLMEWYSRNLLGLSMEDGDFEKVRTYLQTCQENGKMEYEWIPR